MRTMQSSITSLVVAGACVLSACSSLTDVTNLAIVEPAALDNAVGAVARYAGATKSFVSSAQTAVTYTAAFSDEWVLSDAVGNSYVTRLDKRVPQTLNHETGGNYTSYSATLRNLTFAIEALTKFAPTPASRIGQMHAYKGYIEVFIAEEFCNGVPFSTIDAQGNVTYGAATTTTEAYNRAIAHFDSAITLGVDSARVLNFARVGKARALIGLGQFAQAATAVAAVPTNFAYNLEILGSLSGQQNSVYSAMFARGQGVGVGSDGVNGIDWLGANDPRVPLTFAGIGTDNSTRVYLFTKYNSLGSPITWANGIEARLYESEAALQANNNDAATTGTGWLGILNSLRATAITPAMPALADPGNFNARVNLYFREKAFWKFLTATRMGDLRRLVRQYGRAENTVFPSGPYKDGNVYGTEVALELPVAELPNTNYKGCIDKKA